MNIDSYGYKNGVFIIKLTQAIESIKFEKFEKAKGQTTSLEWEEVQYNYNKARREIIINTLHNCEFIVICIKELNKESCRICHILHAIVEQERMFTKIDLKNENISARICRKWKT
jgi:hypothetical protein